MPNIGMGELTICLIALVALAVGSVFCNRSSPGVGGALCRGQIAKCRDIVDLARAC